MFEAAKGPRPFLYNASFSGSLPRFLPAFSRAGVITSSYRAARFEMGTVETLVAASLLLAFAASLPAVATPVVRSGAAAYLAALVAGAFVVSLLVSRQPWMTPGKVAPVAKYAIKELDQPEEKNVLILDGASYVLNGVDVLIVADELKQLGYSARAVKLAFGGANHFERFRLYEDIAKRVPRPTHEGQRWVFLAEVMSGYDQEPLNQFFENPDSARAYYYLSPGNAWDASRAMQSEHLLPPRFDNRYWTVARHAMVNAFNAGVLTRVVEEEDIEPVTGLASKGAKRFKYDSDALLKEAQNPGPAIPIPPWMFEIREPRERAIWGPFGANFVYYGVPSTRPEQLRYIRSFCAATKEPCLRPDEALIKELEAATNWRNAGHLNRNGATIYSRWLAREVVRLGVLAK